MGIFNKKSASKTDKAKAETKTVKPTTTPAPRKVDVDDTTRATPVTQVPSNTPAQTPPNPTILQMPNNWAQKSLRMRANYPTLVDLNMESGGWEEVLLRIQNRLGKTRAEVEQIITAL